MPATTLLLFLAVLGSSHWARVYSQEELGPDNCTDTVPLTSPTTTVPPGTVCITCPSVDPKHSNYTTFELNNQNITDSGEGRVVDGVLVVYDTETTFGGPPAVASTVPTLNCSSPTDNNYTQATVFVQSAPTVLALAEGPIVLKEGETLLVSCYFAGVPLPNEITWNKTGTPLNTSDPRITIETNTETTILIITSVLVSDGGVYTCYATNDMGRASANTSVTVEGLGLPVITGDTTVSEGGTLDLTCTAPIPSLSLHWVSPDGSTVSNSGDLEITNITADAIGEYTCIATNLTTNTTTNNSVIVLVQFAPAVIATQLSPVTLSEGDTLQLSCVYAAFPLPETVAWNRSDSQLNASDPRITILTNETETTLTLTGILDSERGPYTCYVVNDLGTGSATTSVTVEGAPMVLALAEGPIVLTEGETLLVSCYFAGVPLPNEITWNKTGTPLNTSDPRITIETNTDNITLIITSVLVSDGGVYTCYATNDVGRASANTSVTVEGLGLPVITGETTVSEGDTLDLTCTAPIPSLSLHWVSPDGSIVSNSGDLEIANITADAIGKYTCIATNLTTNTTTDNSVIVLVQFAPAVIATQLSPVTLSEGDTLQLSCVYAAFPLPEIVAWNRSDSQLNTSDPRIAILTNETETTLTLTGILDSERGPYTCYVVNDLGTGSDTTSVTVEAVQQMLTPVLFGAVEVRSDRTGECPDTTEARARIDSEIRDLLKDIASNITSNYIP